MNVLSMFGMVVVDNQNKTVGIVDGIDIDENSGTIKKVKMSLDRGVCSYSKDSINFDQICKIAEYITLD
ncbi:hypothetical protein MBCUT_16240 [Methanobrevibacter cuticularis]|uniref:PRC-barrel domain protein n=1 Tax=Methanobrevibacter cuticularis TaxID=47311 RepID=A0A166D3S7_9EURY|nr:hypothetical protein [Methanobrevibacter cuticularis]KZX15170.1 hypothetical protein MBCUT_16240 [Methanobrevibacter cuticularis]